MLQNKCVLCGACSLLLTEETEGLCVDFSRSRRGTDNQDQLFGFSRKPLCVMGCPRKLPVFLRSNSDKNHQAIKLNVMVINIYLHLTYELPWWFRW